jgi:hypothetical protein
MLQPTLFTITLLHVSGLKESSSGSTDIFREHNQQNMSRYKHMIKEQQIECFVAREVATCNKTYNMLLFNLIFTSNMYFVNPAHEMYQYFLRMIP